MNKQTKLLAWGALIGCCVSALISAVPTGLDWYSNPAGIFRGEAGTNWSVVLETHFSWLWPLFLFFAPVSIGVLFWLDRRRLKHAE